MMNALKTNPVYQFFTSLRLTVTLLSISLVIIFFGTLAQEPMGLNIAVERYFKSFFIDAHAAEAGWFMLLKLVQVEGTPLTPEKIINPGWPVFPGGYLVGSLLLINLVVAYYHRFEWSAKKAGIYMTHVGIVTLLVGQLFTDILQEESFVHMERGDRRNYTVSFDDNELALMLPAGGSNRVVSIPEIMLKDKTNIQHPDLAGLTVETEKYWRNARPMTVSQLIDLDRDEQQALRQAKVDQVFAVIQTRITALEERLQQSPHPENRKALTTLKGRAFQQRAEAVELRSLASLLGRVGEMEMEILGLGESDKQLIFNQKNLREMLVAARTFDDQRTVGELFKSAVKGNLPQGTLDEFNAQADHFVPTLRNYREGEMGAMIQAAEKFIIRIKQRAQKFHTGTTEGRLGDYFRFVQPLAPAFDQNDRNQPVAVLKISHKGEALGTWLASCTSEFQQSISVGDQKWKLILRPKRHYLGFHLTLVNLKWEKYRGTEIPKNFQSRVIVEGSSESRPVDISMNEPLREGGQTFYQYQMNQNQLGATVQTVLQVVKNPNWRTAYIGCLIVALGLIYQFLFHLIGFARKRKKAAA
ncbi:MAG TPA: hypothetical protein EYG19_00300 [Verrucomicrobia bacterium]|nr:hypothetical protein [Verrucomicrobiota bacterium]